MKKSCYLWCEIPHLVGDAVTPVKISSGEWFEQWNG